MNINECETVFGHRFRRCGRLDIVALFNSANAKPQPNTIFIVKSIKNIDRFLTILIGQEYDVEVQRNNIEGYYVFRFKNGTKFVLAKGYNTVVGNNFARFYYYE